MRPRVSVIDGGLSALLQANIPEWHWQRIETGSTGLGVPDINYCGDGAEGWCELKVTLGWRVVIRPAQVGWLMRRSRAGGCVHLIVRRLVNNTRRSADEVWIVRGAYARQLLDGGLACLPPEAVAYFGESGPLNWDWTRVRDVLSARPESPKIARLPGPVQK